MWRYSGIVPFSRVTSDTRNSCELTETLGSNPQLMCEIRYLDKLVDELAKGKAMEKILRKADPD